MGLPLFVPPVESDIGRKSHKPASTSPSRSNIRRQPYTGDRSSSHRTARLLEQVGFRRPLPRAVSNALHSENVSTEMVSAAEYPRNGTLIEGDATRSDNAQDSRRPMRMLRMDQRFGTDWRDRNWDHPQQDLDSDWWIVEHRLWGGRARLTRLPHDAGRTRSQSQTPQAEATISRTRPTRRIGASRTSPLNLPWSTNVAPWSPEPTRRETNDDINGLGDRMRSVSPEGWDTLLTTLTPDPQPPSVNSSFVSTAASQNAGASSSATSLSEQVRPAESATEQPCEPSQENTDGEDEENAGAHSVPRGPPRAMNPVRFDIPEYAFDQSDPRASLQRLVDARAQHQARTQGLEELPEATWPRVIFRADPVWTNQHTWTAVPEERAHRRVRRARWEAAASRSAGSTVDEELSGWQRIVRGLADRDDIPDEWWAEAGLSRTLTRDAS